MNFSLPQTPLVLILLGALLSVVATPVRAEPAVQVRALQLASDAASTRLELQLSRATGYKFFLLDGPRRAVLDLQHARLAPGKVLPKPEGLARGLRSGARPDGTWRLVIDLPDGIAARATALAAGSGQSPRLVVELGAGVAGAAGIQSDAGSAAAATVAVPESRPVRAAHAPTDSGRAVIVAIDAGHGGQDPGAIGHGGTREKDVVLAIARDVAARINREPGMRAVLTRQGDYFLTLRQRIGRAREAKADMFVSIHADSVRDRDVAGASVYVLSEKGASDEQSRWLAERENAADLKGGVSLDDKDGMLASVLLDLSQSASIASSMQAAERVLRSINRVAEVRKPRVQQAGFVVLKSPDIPSMLVETAYISNASDERMLRVADRRQRLSEAIFNGVQTYFEDHPPEGTQFAAARRALPPSTAQVDR